jgi:hypothetical protein
MAEKDEVDNAHTDVGAQRDKVQDNPCHSGTVGEPRDAEQGEKGHDGAQ